MTGTIMRTSKREAWWGRGIVSNMANADNGSSQAIAIKSTPWKVRSLAELKAEKRLHLPDLQRGFVWSPERVKMLFDSLYSRYPIGALLLWKPTWPGTRSTICDPTMGPRLTITSRRAWRQRSGTRHRAGFCFCSRWPATVNFFIQCSILRARTW